MLDVLNTNGERVARLRSFHIDGSSLGIEELGRGKGTAREIFFHRYPALEGIIRMYGHPISWLYSGYGLPIRVEDVAVVLGGYLHRMILVGLHLRSSS
jgi:hypothetical protein